MALFAELFRSACLGDLTHLARWRAELAREGDAPGEVCVRVLWGLASDGAPESSLRELTELEASEEKSLCAELFARRSVLCLDWAGLRSATEVLSTSAREEGRAAGELWNRCASILQAPGAADVEGLRTFERFAASQKWATLAVDAVTLQAFAQMQNGDEEAALSLARRAARMAQTEHLWLPHYFATLALVRSRRLTGSSHLATRVADACTQATSKVWHGWLRWERLFAGNLEDEAALGPAENALARAVPAVRVWLQGWAHLGQRPALDAPLFDAPRLSTLHTKDIEAAHVAFGVPTSAKHPRLQHWSCGEEAAPPPELSGLVAAASDQPGTPGGVLAVARPGFPGHRLLSCALPKDVECLPPSHTQKLRVHTLVAALVLAGEEGLSREALFEEAYGFAYRKEIHEAAFRVVRHHASTHVSAKGSFWRKNGRFGLHVHEPFAIVDPRSVRPLKDIMLRHLACDGGSSAKEVAESLGLKLRTVQMALKEMVGDGACSSKRDGRRIAYEVEDTTFVPVTMVEEAVIVADSGH